MSDLGALVRGAPYRHVPEPGPRADGRSITCPRCGLTSHHPHDILAGFCANCDAFRDELGRLPPYRACGVLGCRADVSRRPCWTHRR